MDKDEWMEMINEAVREQPDRREELEQYSLSVLKKVVDATIPKQLDKKIKYGFVPNMDHVAAKIFDEHLPEFNDLKIKGDTKKELQSQISEITAEDPDDKENRLWRKRQLTIAREERAIDNAKSFPEKMIDTGADITEDDPQLEIQRKRREYLAQWDKKIEKAIEKGFEI